MNTPPRRNGTRPVSSGFANVLPPTVVDALQRGDKIEAIKLMRQLTGLGLKEAKDSVDASPQAAASAAAHASGAGLSPGEVPRTGGYVWVAVLAVLFLYVGYRLLRSE